jgi:hypothetical protein
VARLDPIGSSSTSSAFSVRPNNSAQSKFRDGEGYVASTRGDKIERIFAIILRPRPAREGPKKKFLRKSFTSAARLPFNSSM